MESHCPPNTPEFTPQRQPIRFLASFILFATSSLGCATYAERTLTLHNAYYDNQLAAAETAVTEQLKRDRANADLIKLDRALIELAEGNAAASERSLREVRDHFEQLEGPDAIEKGISFLTDDNRRSYAGEDYEKVLIRAFLALANLMHDGGDAEAYSLQLIDKQEQIIAAGADKKGDNPKLNYPRIALAPYLRGILREATHLDYDDAERSYLAVVNWQPAFQAGRFDLERAAGGHHSTPGNGVLYVFALTGRGPYKEEAVEVPSTVSLLIAGEIVSAVGHQTVPPNVAPVKVPRIVARRGGPAAVAVSVGLQSVGITETITDITQLAIQQQEAIYPQIIARAVARRLLKNGIVYGGKEAVGIQKGSLPGLAIDLAGLAWQATESADTRAWGLLPDRIQVLRLELPAGEHDIGLRPVNGGGTPLGRPAARHIRIADGRNTYLLASFPDSHLVGQVLVSEP
jgi:hypothetical protein